MCHGPTSRPPMHPASDGAGGRRIVLEATDGNRFAAFAATTDAADAPGVVILPDVRGLHGFYEELALRFGDAGVHAVAIDYYGRTAGIGSRGADFDHGAVNALYTSARGASKTRLMSTSMLALSVIGLRSGCGCPLIGLAAAGRSSSLVSPLRLAGEGPAGDVDEGAGDGGGMVGGQERGRDLGHPR
jgi:hypothetical protein